MTYINGVLIRKANRKADNGVIHIIDQVLPQTYSNVIGAALSYNLTKFVQLIESSDMDDFLKSGNFFKNIIQ